MEATEQTPATPVADPTPAPVVPAADTPAADPAPPATKPWHQEIYDDTGKFTKGWQEKLPSEMEDLKSIAARYDDLPGILKSLKENMTVARSKGNVKPLGETPTPEEIADYREKMGIPADPYAFEKPETVPDGVEWKEDRIKAFGEWAHKENLTPAQAKKGLELHMKFLSEDYKQASEAHQARMNQQLAAEKKELDDTYGGTLDSTIVAAQRGAVALNIPAAKLDPNSPQYVGNTMLGVFAKVAELMGESRLPTVAAVTNLDPLRQAADIQTNPMNPEHAAFLKGNPQVMAKILELNRIGSLQGRR